MNFYDYKSKVNTENNYKSNSLPTIIVLVWQWHWLICEESSFSYIKHVWYFAIGFKQVKCVYYFNFQNTLPILFSVFLFASLLK